MTSSICVKLDPGVHMWYIWCSFRNRVWHKVVKNWDAICTIYSIDHANGQGARTGAEDAQDSPEQDGDASPDLPPKRQRTGDAILCMLGDMKTSFNDALKSTEPLPMPQVTPPAEILAALQMIPDLDRCDMLKFYGKLIINERLFQALMKLPMDMRKEWLLMLKEKNSNWVRFCMVVM